jgi:hypothetical protein
MIAFTSRAVSVLMIAALASFASTPARAQLHPLVQALRPLSTDGIAGPDPNEDPPPIRFGQDVAIRNGLAFIGMPDAHTTGRVGVFTQGASGTWVRTATIIASDMTSDDEFGRAVSYRDNLLVVGSNRAAYVYKQVNGVWREQQKIVPPAADGVALFARDLKHEAGVLAIGTQGNETTRDSLYVYGQDATGKFVRRARLTVPTVAMRNGFGQSISMTSSMILVGAPNTFFFSEEGEPIGQGEVYAFLPGATQYVEAFRLRALVPPGRVWGFGSTIAMFDGRIAVGYHENTFFTEVETRGSVETFSREGSSVLHLGTTHGFTFARSIAIANNMLLVGSPIDSTCLFLGVGCVGVANLFNLNRFAP